MTAAYKYARVNKYTLHQERKSCADARFHKLCITLTANVTGSHPTDTPAGVLCMFDHVSARLKLYNGCSNQPPCQQNHVSEGRLRTVCAPSSATISRTDSDLAAKALRCTSAAISSPGRRSAGPAADASFLPTTPPEAALNSTKGVPQMLEVRPLSRSA